MSSYHFRHLQFAVLAAIVLSFSSQVLLARSHAINRKVQAKHPAKTQEGKITKLAVGVTPKSFNGHCPKTFDFHCTITVNHSPVTVAYEWVRSDGAKGPREQVEIRHGSVTVSDRWELGQGKQHLREWEKVHIISPKDMNSPAAVVTVNCR